MEWIVGFLFLLLLAVSMVVSLFIAIVFLAGLGEPSHKDIMYPKKKRPF